MKLKLFVFEGFATSPGLAFAIAKDEASARKLVEKSYGVSPVDPRDWGDLKILPLDKPVAFAVSGGG